MRSKRVPAALVALSLALSALPGLRATETPLVIYYGNLMGVIEPGVGTITLCEVTGQLLVRYASTNFLTDLRALRDRAYDERKGITYSYLRVGAANFSPMPGELLAKFPAAQTPEEKANNLPSFQDRAIKAEDDFWRKPPEYDGVVRGAFSKDALFLAIPSLHAILVYELTDRMKGPVFRSFRNVGPDLMVPQVINSIPLPQAIFNLLPEEDQKAREKELQEAFKKAGEKAGSLALQACDWWITASGDRFLLVDIANKHIITYLYNGNKVKLEGVRNIEIDQLIPTGFSTKPNPQEAINTFGRLYKQQIEEYKFVLDRENLVALISQSTIANAAKVSPVQMTASGGDVVLNFTDMRKLFIYRILGQGNTLELVAVRDNTVDIGLQLLAERLSARVRAAEAVQGSARQLSQSELEAAMMTLKYALKEDPSLWVVVEKDAHLAGLHKHPDWDAMIEEAKKAAAAEEAKRQERAKMVEEMKARRKGP